MNWVTGLLVYVILWWLALFCVLPIGVRTIEEPDQPGYGTGAPSNPRILYKLMLATLVSAVLFGITYWLVRTDWISFRPA